MLLRQEAGVAEGAIREIRAAGPLFQPALRSLRPLSFPREFSMGGETVRLYVKAQVGFERETACCVRMRGACAFALTC